MLRKAVSIVMFLVVFGFNAAHADLIINLNDFYADPTVTVAVDGSSALLEEDSSLTLVLLSNDPGLGDPDVINLGAGPILSFDYNFDEPSGNDDEFGAFVIDASTGLSAGFSYEFFTQASSSGTVSFDLSSLAGETLGLQFELNALIGDPFPSLDPALNSSVRISNVRLAPVPVPGAMLLAGLGLGTSVSLLRRKRRLEKVA
jgi:hypothetical protein